VTLQVDTETRQFDQMFIGRLPIMLRSQYCMLARKSQRDRVDLGECPYDQGGYFIINGSEKVLIAQERMANNHVYVFKKPVRYACTTINALAVLCTSPLPRPELASCLKFFIADEHTSMCVPASVSTAIERPVGEGHAYF
jgi:DNA-directed RNA polymerase beta subunit